MNHDWSRIRAHYARLESELVAAGRREWGCDPYAWEDAGIELTPIERWLWHDIRAVDVVLYPQYPVGRFFVDFANPAAKLAVECDGAAFHTDTEKDRRRDDWLRSHGWSVERISGRDCRDGVDSELPSQSVARQFVRRLADTYGIAR